MLTSFNRGYKAATHLQQMCAVRMFAVYPQVIAPRSNTMLVERGRSNLGLTKEYGLDY